VPRAEFACCRVGDDGDLTAAQLSRTALRLLSGPAADAGRQLVCLHGMGNRPPRVVAEVFTRRDRATWSGSREAARANEQLVVQGGDSSCEAERDRARRRLVRGGSSNGELVGEAPN
jgi:hypothetical protein